MLLLGRKTLQVSRREELNSNETEFEQQLSDLNKLHQSKMEKVTKLVVLHDQTSLYIVLY